MSESRSDRATSIAWCGDPARAAEVADLFVAHADPSYISHSELQDGRALEPGRWTDDLHAKISREALQAIGDPDTRETASGTRLAVMLQDDRLRGFALVSFTTGPRASFATLEDLLIAPEARGHGAGSRMLDWICRECRARGVTRLFLESGLGNGRAHHFFEQQGFVQTSIVMMRDV